MGRRLTDKGAYLREAIATIMSKAKEPLDCVEVASDAMVADLEFSATQVSETLARMLNKREKPFPLKRIRAPGNKNTRWKYYNPEVVQVLEDKPRVKKTAAPEPPPMPPAAPPPEFKFDPVPLAKELQQPTVEVPPGVKSITIKVGGVSIHVELDAATVAR